VLGHKTPNKEVPMAQPTQQKKYLKWYNKVGYGSGDLAANMVYGLLTSFVMIYLTDTVGLNAGIVGTLIMLSKFADGITDVFFGNMIDRTKSKLGKARPWMLWSYLGNAVCLVAVFAIPASLGETAKYAYFFIAYTLLNAVFYTANNIAYAALTALITKNANERVQVGSIRFMFSLATNVTVASITVGAVAAMGGGAAGWRNVAIVYALIGIVVNTISVFSIKELSAKELETLDDTALEPGVEYAGVTAEAVTGEAAAVALEAETKPAAKKVSLMESLRLLLANKYYLMILVVYIMIYLQTGISGVGIYYMTYIFHDPALLGTFSMVGMAPMIVGLAATPFLVKKFGSIYKVNLWGYVISLVFRVLFIVAGYMGNIPFMLATMCLAGLATSPLIGDLNALIAEASDYTLRTKGKRVDGTMFSCSSLGIKVGGGLGAGLSGWLLALGGYVANAEVQTAGTIAMLQFMYLWLPLIIGAVVTVVLLFLRVEQANRALKADVR
jgi:GPH family glycoside/pentoside/hexuronide:cation symporter